MKGKYIALLRGINVGGSVLLMSDLKAICEALGFTEVRTYIQSGNVLFESELPEKKIREKLEAALEQKMGRPISVSVRTPEELQAVLAHNPFPHADPKKLGILFLPTPVEDDFLAGISTTTGEEVKLGAREVYIHYPNGMGQSKLKLPKQAQQGTVRNLNTVEKLTQLYKLS